MVHPGTYLADIALRDDLLSTKSCPATQDLSEIGTGVVEKEQSISLHCSRLAAEVAADS